MLCRCAQDVRISGEISLRQGCHHTATARTRDAQANLIADGESVPDPGILNEVPLTGGRLYYDIGSKSPHLKTPSRVQLAQAVERRGRQQMDNRTVEERSRWQSEIGDGVAEVETFHVGPVLFGTGRAGSGSGRRGLLVAVPDGI